MTVTINKVPNLTYENQTSKSITLVLQGLDAKGKEANAEANITKYVIKATFDPNILLLYLIPQQLNSRIKTMIKTIQSWVINIYTKLHSRLL